MTQKGQVTIPAEIRKRLGLKPRDRVTFVVVGENVCIKPAPSRILAGFGAISPRDHPEDWRQIRQEMEQAIADEVVAEG